jgi:adenosylcobinamide kinase/adenosylcobinamide-phosphate guanylyltransferase
LITLLLGGAASGKSAAAERLAARLPQPVTYVATGSAVDEDMAARIAAHQQRRPGDWATVEAGAGLIDTLRSLKSGGTVLIDALGTWVAATPDFGADGAGLAEALRERVGDTVIVSDEVGLGVHPATKVGRRFRDALGAVNQQVAAVADDVLLVVAGRVLRLADVADVGVEA